MNFLKVEIGLDAGCRFGRRLCGGRPREAHSTPEATEVVLRVYDLGRDTKMFKAIKAINTQARLAITIIVLSPILASGAACFGAKCRNRARRPPDEGRLFRPKSVIIPEKCDAGHQ